MVNVFMLRFLPLAALLLFGTATAQDSFELTVDNYEIAQANKGQPDCEFRFPLREYPDTPVTRRPYSP